MHSRSEGFARGVPACGLPRIEGATVGYIEKNLIAGETVLCKTRLHWVAVLMPMLVGLFMAIFAIICFFQASRGGQDPGQDSRVWSIAGIVLLALGAVTVCTALLRRNATEMAVTNRRILIKSGFLSRRTIELLLSRVESIVILEPFFGRMLGYGTVIIRGTGGTPEPFPMIARPTEFRRVVQEQIEAGQAEMRPSGALQRGPGV
jgi:uncharacterized membrane protein YdbT with pleckstrin-like domain